MNDQCGRFYFVEVFQWALFPDVGVLVPDVVLNGRVRINVPNVIVVIYGRQRLRQVIGKTDPGVSDLNNMPVIQHMITGNRLAVDIRTIPAAQITDHPMHPAREDFTVIPRADFILNHQAIRRRPTNGRDLSGVQPDDIHVVGAAGVLLHYDGSAWTQEPSGTANDMISLWGNEADDIVAVGGRAIGTIARWDGASWTVEEVGTLPGLNGVWMDPEGRVSIVGNNGVAAVIRDGFDAETEVSTVSFEVLHAVFGLDDGTRVSVGGTLNSSPPYIGLIIENAP